MAWQIPLILRIVFGNIFAPFLIKKIAQLPSRTRNLVWQYFFAALFATIVALFGGAKFADKQFFIVAVIGAFNAFACYCHWRAVDISLSKTSLFTQADDLIAMGLGYTILHEANFLNALLGLGIMFCIGSASILVYDKWRTRKAHVYDGLLKWAAAYSVIWGIAMFSMRYFSLEGMSTLSYVAAWYQGSFCGALSVFILSNKKEAGEPLTLQQIARVIPLTVTIWISLMLTYWVFMLVPITVAQPILQVSEIVFPVIVGFWIFKEIKELNRISQIAMVVGFVGGIIIMFSYQ